MPSYTPGGSMPRPGFNAPTQHAAAQFQGLRLRAPGESSFVPPTTPPPQAKWDQLRVNRAAAAARLPTGMRPARPTQAQQIAQQMGYSRPDLGMAGELANRGQQMGVTPEKVLGPQLNWLRKALGGR